MNTEHVDLATPLFQEPPDDLDADSTWGFLVGGMAWMERELPADEFMLAAEALVEKALSERDEGFHYAAPVLYLYRHALELYLKQVVTPSTRNHNLAALIDRFEQVLERDFKQKLPSAVKARIHEWAVQDPRSTAFRYSESSAGIAAGEWWVDLHHLRAVMGYLANNFRRMRVLQGKGP